MLSRLSCDARHVGRRRTAQTELPRRLLQRPFAPRSAPHSTMTSTSSQYLAIASFLDIPRFLAQ